MLLEKRRDAALISRITLCVGLLLISATSAHAQDSTRIQFDAPVTPATADAADTSVKSRSCWRGRPQPRCDQFLLTELAYFQNVWAPTIVISETLPNGQIFRRQLDRPTWNVSVEIGGMKNVSKRFALGGTAVLALAPHGSIVGAKARVRRWLTDDGIAVDVGAGFEKRPQWSKSGKRQQFRFTSEVALNAADYVALVARFDASRIEGRQRPEVSLGVRTGSKPAVIIGGSLLAAYQTLLLIGAYAAGGT